MTTFVPYTPSPLAAFQFQAALDSATYNVTVPWNVFGQRWYITITDQGGNRTLTIAMVASPAVVPIETAVWANGFVTITTASPHGYALYSTVALTIFGMVPDAYNGQIQAFVTDASTFTYPSVANPGEETGLGSVAYNISLVAGYFASTLVFREATQTFEITP